MRPPCGSIFIAFPPRSSYFSAMQAIRRGSLKHWVLASLVFASSSLLAGESDVPGANARRLQQKLDTICLPANHLAGTSLRAAIEWLRMHAAARDTTEHDPARKGVNVVVIAPNAKDDQNISLDFPGGTLQEACLAIARASRRILTINSSAISLAPIGMPDDLRLTRQFGVISETSPGNSASIRYGEMQKGAAVSAGLAFPAGVSLTSTASSRLVMRNSQPDLATLEKLRRNP